MSNPRNQDFVGNDRVEGEEIEESSRIDSVSSSGVEISSVGPASRSEIGLTERLTDILMEEGNGDLLFHGGDGDESVLQWLQALDVQVMGACRSDERLKPFLKMNSSNGIAEDCLLAQLSQHFEPAEVGVLARCFCIPLVSIRVGKINRQGTLLCPTTIRGSLNLMVLPTSDFRLSFIGDDGHVERLFTLKSSSQCDAVVNEISADNSGRSFVIKIPNDRVFYFWCSEKSKLLGIEMLTKMKDILKRKPSISDLTGISESRLGCFATHLRSYLVGFTPATNQENVGGFSSPIETTTELSDTTYNEKLPAIPSTQHSDGTAGKAITIYQGSVGLSASSFTEVHPRTLSSLRHIERENLWSNGVDLTVDDQIALPITSSSDDFDSDKVQNMTTNYPFSASTFLESLGNFASPSTLGSASEFPCMVSPPPYYCWCPPGASSTLQRLAEQSQLPTSLNEASSLLLPPFSSLIPTTMPSTFLSPAPTLGLADAPPSMDFPALLSEPLFHFPISASQQIPTFTPLICDPIVHVPVIDVCSSGQGYFVSAGPTISSTITPLHPMIPETDSVVDKNARETLRLLIGGSTQRKPPVMDVLPAVLTNSDPNQSILVAGSRGLYSGTRDVGIIANSIAAMGLVSLSGCSSVIRCSSRDQLDFQPVLPSDLEKPCPDDEDGSFSLSGSREKKFN